MREPLRTAATAVVLVLAAAVPSFAQAPPAPSPRQAFDQACLTCHGNPAVPRAADPAVLRRMTPERIYEALTTGVMRAQAENLSDDARRGIAEYLGDRKLGASAIGDASQMPNRCGLVRRAVLRLRLERLVSPSSQHSLPAGRGGRPDRCTGAEAPTGVGVRGARRHGRLRPAHAGQWPRVRRRRLRLRLRAGPVERLRALVVSGAGRRAQRRHRRRRSTARAAAFFGDLKGNVYAVDVATGEQVWKVARRRPRSLRGSRPRPSGTGRRLYVSVASFEEGASTSARYPCCTFRGSVVALDADTGATIWKTYTIPDAPEPTRTTPAGTQQYGPSGAGVWNVADHRSAAQRAVHRDGQRLLAAGRADDRRAHGARSRHGSRAVERAGAAEDAWIPGCAPGPRRSATVPRTSAPTTTSARRRS